MAGILSSIVDTRFNYYSLVIFLAHKISFSCSPLLTELVELDRKNEKASCICHRSDSHLVQRQKSNCDRDEDNILHYLMRPRTLITLIKRYHGVGWDFLFLASIHFLLLMYLGTKAFFSLLTVGNDPEWSKYCSRSWFPRMLESYPNPESFNNLCIMYLLYYVSLRGLCTYRLVKYAIVNRNGYKDITISQVNFTVAAVHHWKMQDWLDYVRTAVSHRKLCSSDNEARKLHLSFGEECNDIMMRSGKREVMYYNNVIDFTKCYGDLRDKFGSKHLSSWASNWHVAQPACRQDVEDAGRLFILQVIGFSALLTALIVLGIVFFFYEASRLTPNPDESTILETLEVFPDFVMNFSHFIRYLDIMLVLIVQFPNHIEAGLIYWDMTVMISRTRKVCDAISEDLNFCAKKAREYKNSDNHSTMKRYNCFTVSPVQQQDDTNIHEYDNLDTSAKELLNEEIEVHIRLASVLNLEFDDLKRTHTLYLNLLFVGSGFCISICLSLLLVSKSSIVSFLMAGLAISCFIPLFGMVFFCVRAELAVSRI